MLKKRSNITFNFSILAQEFYESTGQPHTFFNSANSYFNI